MNKERKKEITKERFQMMVAVLEDIEFDDKAKLNMDFWTEFRDRNSDDYKWWASGSSAYKDDKFLQKEWDNPSCGTTCCYAGWAFVSPYVRKDMRKNKFLKNGFVMTIEPYHVKFWLAQHAEEFDHFEVMRQIFDTDLQRRTKKATLKVIRKGLENLYEMEFGTRKLPPAWKP